MLRFSFPRSLGSWRQLLTLGVLAVQGGGIIVARWVPERFFCWAPYDALYDYTIAASQAGRALAPAEIEQRYEIAPTGTENRSIHHLLGTIQWVEERHPQPVEVSVRYSLNGGAELIWTWPPP